MKMFKWVFDNILFVFTLFLLAFIPLYPKLPLIDIKNTWVYVRIEDFLIVGIILIWLLLFFKKKISFKTPLTLPIFIFWIIGAVSTIHAMLLIFPFVANVFPNVAFLSYLRQIEYLSLFFIAFSSIKQKSFLPFVIGVLTFTLLIVSLYGIGQRYLGFPAFLTMNEEFAKGTPIHLSRLSRVPSTFGGHYDLAAYLVLVIPILVSLLFSLKNWIVKLIIVFSIFSSFIVLYMTVSRVSFFVLILSLFFVILMQKRKLLIFLIPIVVIAGIFTMSFSSRLLDRFYSTLKDINVLVDAKTGQEIGEVKKVPSSHFENKSIQRRYYSNKSQLLGEEKEDIKKFPSTLKVVPFSSLPSEVNMLSPPNISTGESLPQGTGYINLTLSPVISHVGEFLYDRLPQDKNATADAFMYHGDFLIKKVAAYDLSFTTRFQGEWPQAISAFERNIFLGSGYSSASLAVDNNYLRVLGETGIFGFISFFGIFLVFGIYLKKVLPHVSSALAKSFALGFAAGIIGLALNATLIDVFAASKVAFTLWLLMGITIGIFNLYQEKEINVFSEVKKVLTSSISSILYLIIIGFTLYSKMINNFFIGDDFTWLRWASNNNNVLNYFFSSDGFFYRPGAKLYFFIMYRIFSLNQTAYHTVSLILHCMVSIVFFFILRKIVKDYKISLFSAGLFLVLSGYSEAVFWISATGFLFTTFFSLLSLLSYISWKESKKNFAFILAITFAIFGLFFHELGVITPLIIGLYELIFQKNNNIQDTIKEKNIKIFLSIIPIYGLIRLFSGSHWFSGDYSYNVIKLPFNFLGNAISYFFLTILGSVSLPVLQNLRVFSKNHFFVSALIVLALGFVIFYVLRFLIKRIDQENKKIYYFGFGLFIIGLLPFLGLGNISLRYSYLSSIGVVIIFVFLLTEFFKFLKTSGRDIAYTGLGVIISVFLLLHVMQLQQLHTDWSEAGDKVKTFLTAVDSTYSNYWASEPIKLYFVNVPIRYRQAWVFPVGLKDAVWFAFKNPNIQVFQVSTLNQVLDLVTNPYTDKVFEFDSEGGLIEKRKIINVQ